MKVYFTGAQSSGKSTLARFISDKTNSPLLFEVARQILAEKEIPLDSLRANFELINQFQKEIFYRQIKEEQKEQNFVSDRSLIDALAYTAQHTSLFNELVHSDECKEYIKKLKQPDSFVFFVRPHKYMLKQDGIRESLDWEGVIAIDSMIKMLLQLFGIRYFDIHTGSIQERIQLVESVLSVQQSNK